MALDTTSPTVSATASPYLDAPTVRHLEAFCQRRFRDGDQAARLLQDWVERKAKEDRGEADYLVNLGWTRVAEEAERDLPQLREL